MDLTNEQFWAIDEAVKRDEAWENRKEAVQGIVSRIIIPIVCATQLETENPSTNTHIRVCSTCGKRVYYDNGNCTYPCSCANGWIWVPKAFYLAEPCIYCGPVCYGGAEHNARVKDRAYYKAPERRCSDA